MHPNGAFRGLRYALRLAAIAIVSVALLVPASAQFWSPFGGRSQQRPSQQGGFNPFGGFFGGPPPQNPAPPADYSRAPPPPQRKVDAAAVTTNLVVVGDSMADWLAYGLEEAFAETPEMAIVRKHRTTAGLIRYDTRRDVEWPQVVKEMIAADKPKVLVMMIGAHDRQAIRERTPTPAPARNAAAPKQQQQQQSVTAPPPPPAPIDPELQPPQPGERNAELPETPAEDPAPESPRTAAGNAGPFEFRSERWEAAYIRRIDATIAALKSAGVPVFWVGLPPQRATRATADSTYLNELYRQRAEKAGIVYVDVWEGFVDSSGQFAAQGPDFEGQIRRLRSGDGVYFTKAGARKLAHYVEREIQRTLANRTTPVALPSAIEPALVPGARPGGPAQRPLVGPVVPLTVLTTGQNELLGGGPARPASGTDPVATRVLTKGEAIAAPSGRADDFSWPRGSAASDPSLADTSPMPAVLATPEQSAPPSQPTTRQNASGQGTSGQSKGQTAPVAGSKTSEPKQPVQKRAPPAPSFFDNFTRPPGPIRPSASTQQGAIR
jgi:uncharacterized protein